MSELQSKEVPLEELQEQGVPMVIVGTDVVNLYPSLDIDRVVEDVEQAMLDTKIRWTEIDYLEAARYVALNWSEDECRRSGLGRILPRRRKSGGRRPGLRGAGPQGGVRGDQEQWIFPHVRLRPAERRLLVATVVRLATQAMFQHHYYGFAGTKYQQMGGGPIGLRGTCFIARLVPQVWDRRWMQRVEGAGLKIDLYSRYMDDGMLFLHPVKRGWRWTGEGLVYSKRWEQEDEGRSLLEVSDSMEGISSYLSFTFESGADYQDGWLPRHQLGG